MLANKMMILGKAVLRLACDRVRRRFGKRGSLKEVDMAGEYEEGDYGGWDTDSAEEQGNLPGSD